MLSQAIALINTILGLIEALGPIIAKGVADLAPVIAIITKIVKGEEVTNADLDTLAVISDALHQEIQNSPEEEDDE